MKTFGQRIRELREEKDLSLREFAKSIEVSAAFLSDVQLGRRYPSDKILSNIATKLETTVEELRVYDSRPPLDDIKRLADADPRYSLAFRKVVDKDLDLDELLKFLNRKKKKS